MTSPVRSWIPALGMLLLLAHPARGLGLLADDRSVSIGVSFPGCCPASYQADFFAPFDVPGQSSSITIAADGLGLDGAATARVAGFHDDDGTFHSGISVFSIGFRIDGEGTFEIDGCFDSSHDASPGFASVEVLAGNQPIFSQEELAFEPCPFDPIAFTSNLTPGAYTVEALAQCTGTDCGTSFRLDFHVRDSAVPVPEPATLALLALGLTGLGRRAQHPPRLR